MSPLLQTAASFARAHEIPWPRDPAASPAPGEVPWGVHHDDPPPFNRLRGPVHPRGPQSGVVWQHGREIGAWGEPERADQTFSVAKSYLALLAGVAQGQGLLPDEDAPVATQLPGIGFDSAHNRGITWAQLLTQTSEWEGSCFGLPDIVDRWRQVANDPRPAGGPKGGARPLQAPGTYWEYNDVRINQLSLALLHLFRQPLQQVFLDHVLRPLGGGDGFAWQGYDDAWLALPGVGRVQSVPGGTHWGGGVAISARDQARVGQLLLNQGVSSGRQLIPRAWLDKMAEPSAIAPFYGRLLWLNPDGRAFPGASAQAVFMLGAGGHMVWIDPVFDAVVVLRWLDSAHAPAVMAKIAAALIAG
ncbi:serine hydrolase domain-containing protein [Aquabacterium sp.]|uniref:serine hydrolase domain-containing protein n=1 Tax=Aquabacterium sp. TaxID=1872578 RepID=UPI002C84F0D8|nr:serine hydrolase [Aquabacterium sp.]HSW08727.1 serine hydrolase [Aquabacterium sp.]